VLLFDVEQYPVNPPSERICGVSRRALVCQLRLAAVFKSAIKHNPGKRFGPSLCDLEILLSRSAERGF
jgi:hypothetical protein